MTTIFGKKDNFAIEYEVTKIRPHVFGHFRLWIKGFWIGCFDEEVMLECSLGSLLELVSPCRLDRLKRHNITHGSDRQIMDLLMKDEGDLKDDTMFNVDESTDDFIIHVYKKGDFFKFLWRLCDEPRRTYSDYPSNLLSAEIQICDIQDVVNQSVDSLDKTKKILQ